MAHAQAEDAGKACYLRLKSPCPYSSSELSTTWRIPFFQQGFHFSDLVWGADPPHPLPEEGYGVLGKPTDSAYSPCTP